MAVTTRELNYESLALWLRAGKKVYVMHATDKIDDVHDVSLRKGCVMNKSILLRQLWPRTHFDLATPP